MEPPSDSEATTPPRPLETFNRLLRALDRLVEEARRVESETLREWSALALLDAIDLGDQLGLLREDEAEQRRQVVRAAVEDLDLPPA